MDATYILLLCLGTGISFPLNVAIAITSIVSITAIGAALALGLTQWLQNKVIENTHKDALDPQDPYRFSLSKSEEFIIISKGIDPLRVKCAMVALREKIGEEKVPNLLNRLFTDKGSMKQCYLNLIRQLKRGDLSDLVVGDMHFNLRQSNSFQQNLLTYDSGLHNDKTSAAQIHYPQVSSNEKKLCFDFI